ncbi:MAG: response regulator transcription factor [Pseudomonadota bacterium]
MRILLVEDNQETVAFTSRGLEEAGDVVTVATSAQEGLLMAAAHAFDVIIFDRLLPGMDGLDAVRVLRQSGIETPILVLTALDGIDDRVNGLEAGADDYLTKPFAFAELYARLRALTRRQPLTEAETTRIVVGDLVMERTNQVVTRAGMRLELLPREYRILEYLMLNEGQIVTRTMLLEKIWGYRFDPKTSLVQTHLSRLRAKVDRPFDTELIRTVRGAGYVLSAP